MREQILQTLALHDELSGWEVWTEIAPGQQGITTSDRLAYRRFKQYLSVLREEKLIEPVGEQMRKRASTIWRLTEAGWEALEREESTPEEDAVRYVGKRITRERGVSRTVWKELMRRQRAGELDVVFVTRKTKTSGG